MVSVRPASRSANCPHVAKTSMLKIFSDTIISINMINVKFCMAVVLIEHYPLIPLSLTLIVF